MEAHLTIKEAADRLNLSTKSVQRRIERGTLQSLRRDGRRLIPVAEVKRVAAAEKLGGTDGFDRDTGDSPGHVFGDLSQVLARLEVLAAENGRLRAITQVAESTERQLVDEVHELRAELDEAIAKVQQYERAELVAAAQAEVAPRPRWWRR